MTDLGKISLGCSMSMESSNCSESDAMLLCAACGAGSHSGHGEGIDVQLSSSRLVYGNQDSGNPQKAQKEKPILGYADSFPSDSETDSDVTMLDIQSVSSASRSLGPRRVSTVSSSCNYRLQR